MKRASRTLYAALAISATSVTAIVLWGCAAGNGDEPSGTSTGGSSVFQLVAAVDDQGAAAVSFNVPKDTTKFGVTAELSKDGNVAFTTVVDDKGHDYLHSHRSVLSLGTESLPFLNVVNAPSRDVDPAIDSSARFEADATATGAKKGDSMTFTINSKADGNLANGTLHVNVFYVGDVGQSADTKNVVAQALAEFSSIYQQGASIRVDFSEIDISGDVNIPSPIDGDKFYLAASRQGTSPSVNLFIAGDVTGLEGQVLGIAGGIPGPANPSARSGVAISIITGAGADGKYSDENIRILGETMAHESGHYLGLFHPVELNGDTVTDQDPLDDTPTCQTSFDCINTTNLASNLMYAVPVADGQGGFVPQNQLTGQQAGVMNRNSIVD